MSDSAFPTMGLILRDPGFPDQVMKGEIGLTKRELFSAIFLHASISICNSEFMMRAVRDAATRKGLDMDDYMARESVKTADRLLAELENPHA